VSWNNHPIQTECRHTSYGNFEGASNCELEYSHNPNWISTYILLKNLRLILMVRIYSLSICIDCPLNMDLNSVFNMQIFLKIPYHHFRKVCKYVLLKVWCNCQHHIFLWCDFVVHGEAIWYDNTIRLYINVSSCWIYILIEGILFKCILDTQLHADLLCWNKEHLEIPII